MAVYKVREVFNMLCQIITEGVEYVDIREDDADDSAFLCFEPVFNESFGIGDYELPSYELPNDYDVNSSVQFFKPDDFCGEIVFTYDEMLTLSEAVDNALQYYKECSKDPANKKILSDIKASSVECRNLQAKFIKFLKHVHVENL